MTSPTAPDDPLRAALEKEIGFQYQILRMLGRGGRGAVYHAHERALDRPVAIKVLPPDIATTAEGRERFLREARTAARLTHPNIVPLFTFGETGGLIYYVMGYVDGESLEQRLRRAGTLDPVEASRILEQLAGALDYAHQQGVVHRDVKPDNILIERETGVAKLTDFGIAKRAAAGETLTGTGLVLGTPRYMSPEQASGDRNLDARSDIYSLGLVAYAMLTGRPPFDGASMQEILTQQVTRDAPSLRKMLPDLPSPIIRVVDRALAKNPKDRWQSAGDIPASLREEHDDDVSNFGRRSRKPGVYALTSVITAGFLLNGAWLLGATFEEGPVNMLSVMLATYPLGIFVDYAVARRNEKRSPAELRRMFTEPPRWWPFWWPARWRRTDDVWSRLPKAVRTTRLIGTLGLGIAALAFEFTFLVLAAVSHIPKDRAWVVGSVIFGTYVAALVVLSASAVRGWWWGRKQGLSFTDGGRFSSEPTARPLFWVRPHIARLLSPAVARAESQPRTPGEIASAIGVLVRQLPPRPREVAGDADAAARQLVSALDVLDGEIATLARDVDPAEIERLEGRLGATGPASEMGRLYASQLELLRRLARQREELASRRARYVELLRTLWLQVAALRAQDAADEMQLGDVTGRIRDLCRSVRHEVDGAREAGDLVAEHT